MDRYSSSRVLYLNFTIPEPPFYLALGFADSIQQAYPPTVAMVSCELCRDDSVLQFGGGTLGHPWGNAPGAAANRVVKKNVLIFFLFKI